MHMHNMDNISHIEHASVHYLNLKTVAVFKYILCRNSYFRWSKLADSYLKTSGFKKHLYLVT